MLDFLNWNCVTNITLSVLTVCQGHGNRHTLCCWVLWVVSMCAVTIHVSNWSLMAVQSFVKQWAEAVWSMRLSHLKLLCFVCYAFNAFNASTVSSSYEFLGLRQLGSTLTQCQDLSGSWKKRLEIFSWSRVETLETTFLTETSRLCFSTSENMDS